MKKAILFVDANNWYHNLKKIFEPGKINTQQAAIQVYFYALALSRITNTKLNQFRCGFFNSKEYYEFEPEQIKFIKFS